MTGLCLGFAEDATQARWVKGDLLGVEAQEDEPGWELAGVLGVLVPGEAEDFYDVDAVGSRAVGERFHAGMPDGGRGVDDGEGRRAGGEVGRFAGDDGGDRALRRDG